MRTSRLVRLAAIAVALLYLAGALIVEALHASATLLLYLGVAGLLALASVFTVHVRQRPESDYQRGSWQMTGQRFRDPATGKTMELRQNPATGERDYVEVEDPA